MDRTTGGIGNVTANTDLVKMAMAYARSRVLCAAARLGVADALGDEERDVDSLVTRCGADSDGLYRLLRALGALGLTEETTAGHFRLTEFGQPLRRDSPDSVWADVVFWADLLADDWSLLTDCVRAGKPAYEVRDPKIPSRWSTEPEGFAIFRAVMGTAPTKEYAAIAEAWDFSRAKVVADLGGGAGSLLLAVLERHPHLRGMLVDLEPSVEAARPRFAAGAAASRCELVVADVSEAVPAGADVYMLKHVLHGCRDADAIEILKNCHAVLPKEGSLLIIEFILPQLISGRGPQPEGPLMSDLNMLAVTGGKERSEHQWRTLLEAAGFRVAGVYPVGGDTAMLQNVGILEVRPG